MVARREPGRAREEAASERVNERRETEGMLGGNGAKLRRFSIERGRLGD